MVVSKLFKKLVMSMSYLLFFGVGGVVLLCMAYMLPTQKMEDHVYQDIHVIIEEGNYPEFGNSYFVRMHPDNINLKTFLLNNRGMARDNYTDAIMLGNAISNPKDIPLLQRALQVYRGNAVEHQPIESLYAVFETNSKTEKISYPRYWHGYLVVLKPMLMIFSYVQIKYLNVVLQVILLVALLKNICKRLGLEYASAMAISVLFTFPFIIPFCMQYSTMTYIMLVSSNVLLWKWEFWGKDFRSSFFFLLVGCTTCYFDFLTYPIISLGIPLLLLLSMKQECLTTRQTIHVIGDSCFMWGIGYGGIWVFKWLVATLFGENNIMYDALEQALYRMSGQTDTQASSVSIMKAIFANFSCYTNILFIILILITFALMWNLIKRKNVTWVYIVRTQWSSLLIALLPFIWYSILKNHSYDHSSFTYRAMCVTVFGVWTAILNSCRITKND